MAKSSKKKISTPSAPCSVIITGINSEELKSSVTEALNGIQSKISNASVLMSGTAATAYNDLSGIIEAGESSEIVICPESAITLLPAADSRFTSEQTKTRKCLAT